MKFNKQINNGTLLIPGGAFKISGFEGGEKVEIHTLDSAVVVLKKQMTTMELIQAMDALHRLATELTVHLARVCGTCDDCEDGCPFDDLEDGMLELPDYGNAAGRAGRGAWRRSCPRTGRADACGRNAAAGACASHTAADHRAAARR